MTSISNSRVAGRRGATAKAQRSSFLGEDDVGMNMPALEAALCCFVLHPPITAPSKLRMSFSTSFGTSKTSTLGLVPMQSVTNLGPRHHQGKKVYFVRVRSRAPFFSVAGAVRVSRGSDAQGPRDCRWRRRRTCFG